MKVILIKTNKCVYFIGCIFYSAKWASIALDELAPVLFLIVCFRSVLSELHLKDFFSGD